MKTSAFFLSLAALGLLAGCTTSQVTWSKVGVTQEQGRKDLDQCAAEAGLMTREAEGKLETGALLGRAEKDAAFERCMTGKGYRRG